MALTKDDLQEIEKLLTPIKAQINDIQLTLENETNKNIRLIADGHFDLNCKIEEALQFNIEKERLLIRVNSLENELRRIKNRLSA